MKTEPNRNPGPGAGRAAFATLAILAAAGLILDFAYPPAAPLLGFASVVGFALLAMQLYLRIQESADARALVLARKLDAISNEISAVGVQAEKSLAALERSLGSFIRDAARSVAERSAELSKKKADDAYRQAEALLGLYADLEPAHALPAMRGFAGSPDFCAIIVREILEGKPRIVVEFGSGASTVLAAMALEKNGTGKIISFDQDGAYAARTAEMLRRRGLGKRAEVIHAPLASGHSEDDRIWYDIPAGRLSRADLVIVDGPFVAQTGQGTMRYPAMPFIHSLLSKKAVVILDDASRESEAAVIERWKKEFPEFDCEMPPAEKGCAVFRRRA